MRKLSTGRMVRLAILVAIIVLMAFTPLGYLRIGVVSITFLMIPVVIGAIIMGPAAGAFLGGVFGLTSFIQCFGMDAFGTALFSINPILTFIMCMVPRILMGYLSGLIFKAVAKVDKTKVISYAAATLSGALINTILFVGCLIAFFGTSDYLKSFGDSIPAILGALITFNSAIEAGVCLVVGSAIAKALDHYLPAAKAK